MIPHKLKSWTSNPAADAFDVLPGGGATLVGVEL